MKECCGTPSSEGRRGGRRARIWIVLALLAVVIVVLSVTSKS
jgi:hypothetical protein